MVTTVNFWNYFPLLGEKFQHDRVFLRNVGPVSEWGRGTQEKGWVPFRAQTKGMGSDTGACGGSLETPVWPSEVGLPCSQGVEHPGHRVIPSTQQFLQVTEGVDLGRSPAVPQSPLPRPPPLGSGWHWQGPLSTFVYNLFSQHPGSWHSWHTPVVWFGSEASVCRSWRSRTSVVFLVVESPGVPVGWFATLTQAGGTWFPIPPSLFTAQGDPGRASY